MSQSVYNVDALSTRYISGKTWNVAPGYLHEPDTASNLSQYMIYSNLIGGSNIMWMPSDEVPQILNNQQILLNGILEYQDEELEWHLLQEGIQVYITGIKYPENNESQIFELTTSIITLSELPSSRYYRILIDTDVNLPEFGVEVDTLISTSNYGSISGGQLEGILIATIQSDPSKIAIYLNMPDNIPLEMNTIHPIKLLLHSSLAVDYSP